VGAFLFLPRQFYALICGWIFSRGIRYTLPMTLKNTPEIRAFIDYCRFNEGLSDNTLAAYERDLKAVQKVLPVDLSQASTEQIESFLLEKHLGQTNARSIARSLSSLKRFYRYWCLQNPSAEDPVALLKAPALIQSIPTVISEAQVDALLRAPDLQTPLGCRDKAILELMYASGLRVSEVVSLPFEQLNLSAGLVQVTGKGNKERIVPLGEMAIEALENYLKTARPALVPVGKWIDSLFVSRIGRTMTRQTLWHRIKKLAMIAGIDVNLSPHSLRHAFATHLINHGADLRTVQLLLGHADLSTTQIYTHVAQARMQKIHQQRHPRG